MTKPYKFRIALGGKVVQINSNDEAYIAYLKDKYRYFLSSEQADSFIDISIKMAGLKEIVEKYGFPFEGDGWAYSLGDKKIPSKISINDSVLHFERPTSKGQFNWKEKKGSLILETHQPSNFLELMPSTENFLRICYSLILFEQKAILFHSSAVNSNEKGVVFTGTSGAGKSTIARLSRLPVLNDELNLLTIKNGVAYVQSTPFGGELAPHKNNQLPLDTVYYLRKNDKTERKKLDLEQSITEFTEGNILFCSVGFKQNPLLARKIFSALSEIFSKTQAYALYFEKNRNFMKYLKSTT